MAQQIPRQRFLPLAGDGADGGGRRLGVEIEFGGLTEAAAAAALAAALGGTARQAERHAWRVEGGAAGDLEIELDTKFSKGEPSALMERGLALGREVIPVEVVTTPLPPAQFGAIERLREALREAGAEGSRRGLLLGFGLHLNIEAGPRETVPRVARAFALLEDWLRYADPIDGARRLLPFVDPWPQDFVRALLEAGDALDLQRLGRIYLDLTPTRNRALDLLPLLADAGCAEGVPAGMKLKPRPAYHYRLPDSRVDEAEWTIAYEWNRWALVETVAADDALLAALAQAWLAWHAAGRLTRHDWCATVDAMLAEAGAAEQFA